MKPFLLLSHRPEDIEAEREHKDIARYAKLQLADIDQRRLEQEHLGDVDLERYSGVFIGGGPYNLSDASKSHTQQRVERELLDLTRRCLATSTPFFGICYGLGVLAVAAGGRVEAKNAEEASAPWIATTADGDQDPVVQGLPELFQAFTGHKESVTVLPREAVVLASNRACPNQMIRVGDKAYGVQFHPELNGESLAKRLIAYKDFGYFPAGELDERVQWARRTDVGGAAHALIRHFVRQASGQPRPPVVADQ